MRRAARHARRAIQAGFSLLEVLVAFAVMAIALGLLYQVAGSNARATSELQGQAQAMALAESLLAAHAVVPEGGLQTQGESQGYAWQVQSAPITTPANANPQAPKMHELHVRVQWPDGARTREFAVVTVRPERLAVIAVEERP